jgi:hypothetical protein
MAHRRGAGTSSKDEPIRFSQTPAARTRIHDTLGLPKEKENGASVYVLVGLGTVLCGAILYSCIVGSPKGGNEWLAAEAARKEQEEQQQGAGK